MDILVVGDGRTLNFVSTVDELMNKLSLRHIDISQRKSADIANMDNTIFNYDFVFGAALIYGDEIYFTFTEKLNT